MNQKKIEEWIKEIEERPSSAALILTYIGNRLEDLTNRNEQLTAEVIALQSGNRIEDYERRISYLEYQLELLKRQVSENTTAQLAPNGVITPDQTPRIERPFILIYNSDGRVLRFELPPSNLLHKSLLAEMEGELNFRSEPPRLLAVRSEDEVLFLFTSGRIAVFPLETIPSSLRNPSDGNQIMPAKLDWQNAAVPSPPHSGEKLVCIIPISKLSLADFFVQVSRRGFIKKIRIAMAAGILQNRFIGTGVRIAPDRCFDLMLSLNDDRIAFVSKEGRLVIHEIGKLPVSPEQVIRMSKTDHLVAAFHVQSEGSVIVMTNNGKIIHLTKERLKTAEKIPDKGTMLISSRRLQEGINVVGATALADEDKCCVLNGAGELRLYDANELAGGGIVPGDSDIVTFCTLPKSNPFG